MFFMLLSNYPSFPIKKRPAGKSDKSQNSLKENLFYFYFCASLCQLCLDSLSIILGYAFLNRLWSLVNNSLSFLQAQTCDLANNLDNVDLVSASGLQDTSNSVFT